MFLVRIRSRGPCEVVDSVVEAPSLYAENGGRRSWMSGFLCGRGTAAQQEFLRGWSVGQSREPMYEGGFSLVQTDDRVAFMARDRDGLYPLYYCRIEGDWLFSDSIFRLAGYSGLTEPDPTALGHFFAYDGWNSDVTLLAGIRMIPAGSTWKLEDGRMTEIAHYELPYTELDGKCRKGLPEMAEDTIRLLNGFIERIENAWDGPFCNLLSGGVDSSLFQGLLSARNHKASVCATYENNGPDGDYARSVAPYLDTDLTVEVITNAIIESSLPKFIDLTESPFVYEGEVMKGTVLEQLAPRWTASFHCNGTGALFGSRESLRLALYMARLPRSVLRILSYRRVPERIRQMSRCLLLEDTSDSAFLYAFCNSLERMRKAQQLVPEFVPQDSWRFEVEKILAYTDDPAERLRRFDTFHASVQVENSILFRVAANSGVFLAQPFMDPQLGQYLLSIPLRRLFGLFGERKIEKLALRRFLPQELIYRKKVHKGVDWAGLWASSSYFGGIIDEILDCQYEWLSRIDRTFFMREVELAKKLIAFHIWYKRVKGSGAVKSGGV